MRLLLGMIWVMVMGPGISGRDLIGWDSQGWWVRWVTNMAMGQSKVRNFSATLLPQQAQGGGSGGPRMGSVPSAVTMTTGEGACRRCQGLEKHVGGPAPVDFSWPVLPHHSEVPLHSVLLTFPPFTPALSQSLMGMARGIPQSPAGPRSRRF